MGHFGTARNFVFRRWRLENQGPTNSGLSQARPRPVPRPSLGRPQPVPGTHFSTEFTFSRRRCLVSRRSCLFSRRWQGLARKWDTLGAEMGHFGRVKGALGDKQKSIVFFQNLDLHIFSGCHAERDREWAVVHRDSEPAQES